MAKCTLAALSMSHDFNKGVVISVCGRGRGNGWIRKGELIRALEKDRLRKEKERKEEEEKRRRRRGKKRERKGKGKGGNGFTMKNQRVGLPPFRSNSWPSLSSCTKKALSSSFVGVWGEGAGDV